MAARAPGRTFSKSNVRKRPVERPAKTRIEHWRGVPGEIYFLQVGTPCPALSRTPPPEGFVVLEPGFDLLFTFEEFLLLILKFGIGDDPLFLEVIQPDQLAIDILGPFR